MFCILFLEMAKLCNRADYVFATGRPARSEHAYEPRHVTDDRRIDAHRLRGVNSENSCVASLMVDTGT